MLTLTQKITGNDAKEATISFTSTWTSDGYVDGKNSATRRPQRALHAGRDPVVEAGKAGLNHTSASNGGKSTATVTLNDGVKLCEGEPVTLVSYYSPKPQFSVPQYKYDDDSGKITNEQRSVTLERRRAGLQHPGRPVLR